MASITGGYNSSHSSNQFQNQGTSNTSGTSTTARNLLPGQSASASDIFSVLHNYMMNPQAAVNPSRMAARDQVNRNYAGLADRVRQQFLTTGGGASGKAGQAQLQGELARSGEVANVDNAAAQQAAALPLTAAGLAEQFLGINLGQTTTGNELTNTTNSGTSSGSSSGWGIGASAKFTPSFGSGGGGGDMSYGPGY